MKNLFVLILLVLYSLVGMARDADRILGVWWNDEKTTQIEVEKKDGKYIGTIIHINPEEFENGVPPKDDENPDKSLRNRSIIGIQILSGFEYDAKNKEWKEGSIYDPKSGKTYDCYAWLESDELLKLKGFVAGIRWMGKSSVWYRATL